MTSSSARSYAVSDRRRWLVALWCCATACGRWNFVENSTTPLPPIRTGTTPGTKSLVAQPTTEPDGSIDISAHVEENGCMASQIPRSASVTVEQYYVPPKTKTTLLALGWTFVGLGALFLIGAANSTGDTAGAFTAIGGTYVVIGFFPALIGTIEAKRNGSKRRTEHGVQNGAPETTQVPCPKPKLDRVAVIAPWGERFDAKLHDGKAHLKLDFNKLAASGLADDAALAREWKLFGGEAGLEASWRPNPSELTPLHNAYREARKKIDVAVLEKRRRELGPPRLSVAHADSEFEVVPAGLATKIKVTVANAGPGPAEGAAGVVTVRGVMAEQRFDTGPINAGGTAIGEVTVKLPANHPGGQVQFDVKLTDPSTPTAFDSSFTITANKQVAGSPVLVVEKFEAKGPLRAGMTGEIAIRVRNAGTAPAYGVQVTAKTIDPTLDKLNYKVPYVKPGAKAEATIPISFPRVVEDTNPGVVISAAAGDVKATCGDAVRDCYVAFKIGAAPVPVLKASCEITSGAKSAQNELMADAGAQLDVRCKIDNSGEEAAHVEVGLGIDAASGKPAPFDLAPGASTTQSYKIGVPVDSTPMKTRNVVVQFSAAHATGATARLPFRVGKEALCAPNSLDDAHYKEKRDKLRQQRDDGNITPEEYAAYDRELLGCRKR